MREPREGANISYSSSDWARTALKNVTIKTQIEYKDSEVDLFYNWIIQHSNRDSTLCFGGVEVRQNWTKPEFEKLLEINDLTHNDVMYTMMKTGAEGGIGQPLAIRSFFSQNKFIDNMVWFCPATPYTSTIGKVLASFHKCELDNTCTTATNYLDTTDPNSPNYIEPKPFYKQLWFYVLIILILLFIAIKTKK